MAERKNPELDAQHQAILKRMMQLTENRSCADCKAPYPRWASVNLGIFICMNCSGTHRKLGTHLSQVRSVTLDTWTASQVARFQKLGNAKAGNYFESCLPESFQRPSSSDSMRMEAFIRDKYERRKYITVENGGLGGGDNTTFNPRNTAPANSNRSAFSMGTTRPRQSGSQQRGAYDDPGRGTRPASSTSYGARFNNGATNATAPSRPAVRNGPPAPTHSNSGSRALPTKNPLLRAKTLKELVNMGFETNTALRAIEQTDGNLQRAVDWLIDHAGDAKESSSRPNSGLQSTSKQSPPLTTNKSVDLLDFSDAAPAPVPTKVSISTSSSKESAPHFNDDFVDFGDFESALPKNSTTATSTRPSPPAATATAPSKQQVPTTRPVSLSSNLADLYKRPAPSVKKAQPPSPSGFQFAASPPSKAAEIKKQPVAAMVAEDFGLATFDIKPMMPNMKSTNGSHKPSKAPMSSHPAFAMAQQPGSNTAAPPPPPPMQESAFMSSFGDPPPPSPPRGYMNPGVMSMSTQDRTALNDSNGADSTTIAEDTSPLTDDDDDEKEAVSPSNANGQNENGNGMIKDVQLEESDKSDKKKHENASPKAPEDDDPFADLSIFALSSAGKK